jgi:hypothetical protein
MTPAQPGVGVVGVYFHEGRLGVLYAPLVRDEPERYPNVTQDQFEERVRMRNGVTLQGVRVRLQLQFHRLTAGTRARVQLSSARSAEGHSRKHV